MIPGFWNLTGFMMEFIVVRVYYFLRYLDCHLQQAAYITCLFVGQSFSLNYVCRILNFSKFD